MIYESTTLLPPTFHEAARLNEEGINSICRGDVSTSMTYFNHAARLLSGHLRAGCDFQEGTNNGDAERHAPECSTFLDPSFCTYSCCSRHCNNNSNILLKAALVPIKDEYKIYNKNEESDILDTIVFKQVISIRQENNATCRHDSGSTSKNTVCCCGPTKHQQNGPNTACLVLELLVAATLFNMAISHHVMAASISTTSQKNRVDMLCKAEKLYFLAFELLSHQSNGDFEEGRLFLSSNAGGAINSMIWNIRLGCICNLSHILHFNGNHNHQEMSTGLFEEISRLLLCYSVISEQPFPGGRVLEPPAVIDGDDYRAILQHNESNQPPLPRISEEFVFFVDEQNNDIEGMLISALILLQHEMKNSFLIAAAA